MDQQTNQAARKISWQTKEYEYHEKDAQWFVIGAIIIGGIFLSLLIMKNIFGAATILLLAFIVYLYAVKKPGAVSVTIGSRGIAVNNKLISYSNIASFWIAYDPPVKELIVIRKEHLVPKTVIPLGPANPVKVRDIFLANAVKEKNEDESLIDLLARRLRF